MSIRRLRSRVPSARKVGTGFIEKHELRFHKVSANDGSAKCDAYATGMRKHLVYGVLFDLAESDKTELDRIEGLGYGYEVKTASVRFEEGTIVEAFTYYATSIDPALRPLDWYKEHVLRGARENQLPEHYVRLIQEIEFDRDPDNSRREQELSIYRC